MIFFRHSCIFVICLALASASFQHFAQPKISGKISGGFQAPSNIDADGRRHVVRGKDVESRANNVLELTEPRVTRYNPDDTPDMFIESARCFYDTKAGVAHSPTNLLVRTADSRFSIEGVGWHWDLSGSLLTISNEVKAVVQKAALSSAGGLTNLSGTVSNEPVRVTAAQFRQDGDAASFIGSVVVRDGEDTLRCDRLNIHFVKPGGAQRIEALHNVEIDQAENIIRCGQAVYEVKQNIIRVTESPTWASGLREGSAELLVLDRTEDTLSAQGKVFMKLPVTNLVIGADSFRTNTPSTNRFVEIRSDQFRFQNARSNRIANAVYTGHVEVSQADGTLYCAQLTANFSSNNRLSHLLADEEVRIQSGENRVFGTQAEYDFTNEKVVVRGAPRWEIGETRGRSDTLVFFPKSSQIVASNNVAMTLPGRSMTEMFATPGASNTVAATNATITITAGLLTHAEKVSTFERQVLVADARGTMECATLTVFTGQSNQVQRIVAEHNVVLKQPDLVALGDRAEYEEATGLVRLTGDPELLAPDKRLQAEMFIIDRNRNTFSVSPGKYRIQLELSKRTRESEE